MVTKSKKFQQLQSNSTRLTPKAKETPRESPASLIRKAKEKAKPVDRGTPANPASPEEILRAKKRSIAKKPFR